MRYLCGNKVCGKVFLHTAKKSEMGQEGDVIGTMDIPRVSWETMVCPFCHSIEYSEYVETELQIASLKSVPLDDVDYYLKKDYVVKDTFAKTATLIKREEAKGQ